MLDQDPLKKLAHACKYGLLKQALYLKSEPEYCVFIIRSMSCVLTGRMPTCNGEGTLSSVCMRQNFKWILVKQPENLCNLAWKCLAGMWQMPWSATDFLFQIFNVIGQALLPYSKFYVLPYIRFLSLIELECWLAEVMFVPSSTLVSRASPVPFCSADRFQYNIATVVCKSLVSEQNLKI